MRANKSFTTTGDDVKQRSKEVDVKLKTEGVDHQHNPERAAVTLNLVNLANEDTIEEEFSKNGRGDAVSQDL